VGHRSQPITPLLLAHAACLQHDCLLFADSSDFLHGTCDVVRGLRSLSEGSLTPDRRWSDNGVSVGRSQTLWDRWTSLRRASQVFRRLFVWKAAWHTCNFGTEAAGGGFEDCERRAVSSTEGSR